jgi:hypothetical protein
MYEQRMRNARCVAREMASMISLMANGRMPGEPLEPSIVCVLPAAVCPYAKTVPL